MIDEERLSDLLRTWEEQFERGEDVLAAVLCQDCPELEGILAERIGMLKKTMWMTKRIDTNAVSLCAGGVPALPSGADHSVIAGQYRLDHFLAAGGFGQVWRGFDLVLERSVAIKVPNPDRLADAAKIERFLAEARHVARLRHLGIVPVYNVVRHKGIYFIVMELIEGKDLRQQMKDKKLTVRESVRIVLDVADAVEHAHRQGVIHRDIKPANILIEEGGAVFITDFGIASPMENDPKTPIYGTLPYMSPEQRQGLKCDARSDVYSLGGVLYELLTGNSPTSALPKSQPVKTDLLPNEQLVEEFNKMQNLPPHPHLHGSKAASTDLAIPLILTEICAKSLAVNPNDRYETVRGFADALRNAVSRIVTETDWVTCTDSARMLAHLCNLGASARKMRLFACECVGPEFFGLPDRSKQAVIVAERFADGNATKAELNNAANGAWAVADELLSGAVLAAAFCAEEDAFLSATKTARHVPPKLQCQVLHDLFGSTLFRVKSVDPSWLTWKNGIVVRHARSVYMAKGRGTKTIANAMREIGDLLQEAGCTDPEILAHCREESRHHKGCWVLDLLLGKS